MKTFVIATVVAALAAFAIFPLSLEVTISVLFGAGLFLIAAGDYSRKVRPIEVPADARVEKHALAA